VFELNTPYWLCSTVSLSGFFSIVIVGSLLLWSKFRENSRRTDGMFPISQCLMSPLRLEA
jgi:hypothetical protein